MRKLISMAAFFFAAFSFLSTANALYGGETISYQFPKCDMLAVNITNASLSEWSASPNCMEESAGMFSCGCADGWTLFLAPKVNAVGSYNITMTAYSGTASTTQTVSYNNGYVRKTCKPENYVCTQFQSCCAGLACEHNICIHNATVTTTTTTTIVHVTTTTQPTTTVPTTTATTLPEVPSDNSNLWLWALAGVILTPLIVWYLNNLRIKNQQKKETV
jgi:hypothetical protein